MSRESTQLISLRIPRRVSARLTALSKKRGTTVSAIVREALEALTEDGSQSAWSLGAHLFGQAKARAPADLSTNKKYLRGLGR
jgi:Ribbon-helix-helix protein, copG family